MYNTGKKQSWNRYQNGGFVVSLPVSQGFQRLRRVYAAPDKIEDQIGWSLSLPT